VTLGVIKYLIKGMGSVKLTTKLVTL